MWTDSEEFGGPGADEVDSEDDREAGAGNDEDDEEGEGDEGEGAELDTDESNSVVRCVYSFGSRARSLAS